MPSDAFHRLASDFGRALVTVIDQNRDIPVSSSIHKERYRELLETMRACGELEAYEDHYHVDPETGILCVDIGLKLPRYLADTI